MNIVMLQVEEIYGECHLDGLSSHSSWSGYVHDYYDNCCFMTDFVHAVEGNSI